MYESTRVGLAIVFVSSVRLCYNLDLVQSNDNAKSTTVTSFAFEFTKDASYIALKGELWSV